LQLRSPQSDEVRDRLSLGKTYWLRRLTPVELERLNGFPDDHTELATDGRRAFFMGNALVCGLVALISDGISSSLN
jgi:DNA (cytosine-5)-methyltransferase 1